MKRLIPLLNKFVPDDLAEKGLSKINPKLKSFFSNSARSGLGAGAALSFLRNSFKDPAVEAENARLKQGVKSQTLRPDEKVSARNRADDEQIGNLISKAATLGSGLAGGAGILGSFGGLLGSGQDQFNNPKQQSPMSGQQMEQDVQAQGMPQDQSAQQNDMIQDDFSDILNHIKNRVTHGGRSLEQAAQEVGSHKQFRDKVMRIEQSGVKFMDWVRQNLGGQQGQMGQNQGQGAGAQRLMALLQSRPKR